MKKKRALDNLAATYAGDLAAGRGRTSPAAGQEVAADFGAEGKVLMNAIEKVHEALRPMAVPQALAARVRDQVRLEIEGAAPATAKKGEPAGIAEGFRTAARAFLRRAGELVININVGELLGGKGILQPARPAEVYAYSVIEALDKAARRRKARILMDPQGRIYEVPQSVLKRRALSADEIKRRGIA